MPTHDLLQDILQRLGLGRESLQGALQSLQDDCLGFVCQRYPLHHERIGDPLQVERPYSAGGPAAYEARLVIPFAHGYRANTRAMREELHAALERRYEGTRTQVGERRLGTVLMREGMQGHAVLEVLPAMEHQPDSYLPFNSDTDKHYLLLHDRRDDCARSTNIARLQRRLLALPPDFAVIIDLLYCCIHKHELQLERQALQLMVFQAAHAKAAPKGGSSHSLLRYFLQWAVPFLRHDGALQDIAVEYPWPDYLSHTAKLQLARLWQDLLAALEHGDHSLLRSFFT